MEEESAAVWAWPAAGMASTASNRPYRGVIVLSSVWSAGQGSTASPSGVFRLREPRGESPVSAVTSSKCPQSHHLRWRAMAQIFRRSIVTVKKTARWTGAKKAGSAAAGKAKARSDRKLQREAEQRRRRTEE